VSIDNFTSESFDPTLAVWLPRKGSKRDPDRVKMQTASIQPVAGEPPVFLRICSRKEALVIGESS
jgi:hypothetical protein